MSSKPHLQIFNRNPSIDPDTGRFTLFPQLPKELRLKIWRHALQRERIIRVHLTSWYEQGVHHRLTKRFLGGSERYSVTVEGYQVLSKLLRVDSESRAAALSFFRVQIPCELSRRSGGPTEDGICYINPEYDFLFISSGNGNEIIDFLHDLKTTHDPLRIGLLNLALGLNDFNQFQSSDEGVEKKTALVETLTQLQEVFIMDIESAGRVILPFWSGIPTKETIFNRSYPTMPLAPTFERLLRDPRPIDQDLKHVYLGTFDPRHNIQRWQTVLTDLGVYAPHIKYRVCIACRPFDMKDVVYDRQSAEKMILSEDNFWTGAVRQESYGGRQLPVGAESEQYKNEDLGKAVRPAFGFWLFPLEAVGSLKEEEAPDSKGFVSRGKQLRDMTGYWPELALSSLP